MGLFSGILVVLFKLGISVIFDFTQNFANAYSLSLRLILLPLIAGMGGLLAGWIVKYAPSAKGSGIPYVKMSLAGMVQPTNIKTVIIKFFSGVIGIGTGLSLGREGPSVQLGAGAGDFIGRLFGMKGSGKDNLIAAGAGAAIGATFNAPIAGAVFVVEELVNKFAPSLLFPVLTATVTASSFARYVLGNTPSFNAGRISLEFSPQTLVACVILGTAAGLAGTLFSKVIYFNNSLFRKMSGIPSWVKPGLAGCVVGLVGVFLPYVLSSGNSSVDLLLQNKLSISVIGAVFLFKFFVTPLCFGSGAAGGIFLPMLMLGAFLGYLVAALCNLFGADISCSSLALAGMGAFLAAVGRTPITAAVMVFEMTGGYTQILPIMLCVALADLIAERLGNKPIYSMLIVKDGSKSGKAEKLSKMKIADYMIHDVDKLDCEMTVAQAIEKFKTLGRRMFPVIDKNGKLAGTISKNEIEDFLYQENHLDAQLYKVMNAYPDVININSDLYLAYYELHFGNHHSLIVCDGHRRVKGIITRFDLNTALAKNNL